MTVTELRQYIIEQIKTHKPEHTDQAETIADFVLSQPFMQSESGVNDFLDGYLSAKGSPKC